jgi:hypothetical protein
MLLPSYIQSLYSFICEQQFYSLKIRSTYQHTFKLHAKFLCALRATVICSIPNTFYSLISDVTGTEVLTITQVFIWKENHCIGTKRKNNLSIKPLCLLWPHNQLHLNKFWNCTNCKISIGVYLYLFPDWPSGTVF